MQISDTKLPPKPSVQIHPDVLLERPQFCQGVALAIAIWADIEARLDAIFISTIRDPAAIEDFRQIRGWDKRTKLFVEAVRSVKGDDAAIEAKAVLAVVTVPANMRNEVAHGIWAKCLEVPNDLVLLGSDIYSEASKIALEAHAAGTPNVKINEEKLFKSARLVSIQQLRKAIDALLEARGLVHALMIEAMPETVHVHGRAEIERVADHPEVAARIINAKRSLKKANKGRS
jgi:hypothetical protein